MSTPRIEVKRTVIERGTFKAPVRDAILNWHRLVETFNIPEGALMEVEIPGGGDYSGMRIDASQIEVVVTWKVVKDAE